MYLPIADDQTEKDNFEWPVIRKRTTKFNRLDLKFSETAYMRVQVTAGVYKTGNMCGYNIRILQIFCGHFCEIDFYNTNHSKLEQEWLL